MGRVGEEPLSRSSSSSPIFQGNEATFDHELDRLHGALAVSLHRE